MKKCVFLLVVFIVSTTSVFAQPSSSSVGSTVEEFYKSTYVHKRTSTIIQFTVEGQRDSSWRSPELKKNESYVAIKPIFRHVDVNIQKTPLISAEDAVKALTSPGVWIGTKPAVEGYPPNDFKEIKNTYDYGRFPYLFVTIKQASYYYKYNDRSNPARFEKKIEIVDSVNPALNIWIIWFALVSLVSISIHSILKKNFSVLWGVGSADIFAVVAPIIFWVVTMWYGWTWVWHVGGYYVLILVIYQMLSKQMKITESQMNAFKIMEHCLITVSSILLLLFFILGEDKKFIRVVEVTLYTPFLFALGCVYLNLRARKQKLFSKAQK